MEQPMSRSTDGCWTCRIRHRKCDESHPVCKECSDRLISCHGYGPKPGWVNDSSQLEAELKRIKRAVNENFRRNKRLLQGRSSTVKGQPDGRGVLDLSEPSSSKAISLGVSMSYRESHLLIHYLDYIFPLQFPFYVDNPERGGRGWLFWLLMRNGPLNQAILTLSALHHHTRFSNHAGTGTTERELIEYHTRALHGLRQTLIQYQVEGVAPSNERLIDFLGCGSTLLSFEIFQGGTAGWQPHLNALSMVVDRMIPPTLQVEQGAFFKAAEEEADSVENAKTFLVADMLWFDLLSCTSCGASPKISSYKLWLTQSGIEMGPLMGCYNWAMEAIGDIGALSARVASGDPEVSADAIDVKDRLEAGLSQLDSAKEPPTPRAHAVSRVFARAALVELYTICPDLCMTASGVTEAVAGVMYSIRILPERVSLRGLTWPICIAGSMADPDQQPFFETMVSKILNQSRPGFTNCDTVFRIIRQCWSHRRNYPEESWNWRDAMKEMGICALLV